MNSGKETEDKEQSKQFIEKKSTYGKEQGRAQRESGLWEVLFCFVLKKKRKECLFSTLHLEIQISRSIHISLNDSIVLKSFIKGKFSGLCLPSGQASCLVSYFTPPPPHGGLIGLRTLPWGVPEHLS